MTTDHDLIARACRRVRIPEMQPGGLLYEVCWGEDPNAYQALHRDNPALHALLVIRLQDATGVSITPADTLHGRGWHIGRLKREGGAIVLTPIDIIRVLVEELEGER